MRFLVDESTGRRFNALLKRENSDTIYVGDILRGCSDDTVLTRAEIEKRILITDDKDFGELIFRLEKPSSGVVLFRSSTNPDERVKILLNIIRTGEKLESCFVTIRENKYKIRRI